MQNVIKQSVCEVVSGMIPEHTLIIVSTTSFSKLVRKAQQTIQKIGCPVVYSNRINASEFYETIMPHLYKYSKLKHVIGIGGGTVIDYSKYIAKHKSLQCTVIPSMLSTNAFATDKIAVITRNGKHTENGVLPQTVILDEEFLNKSPKENFYGVADVFSIYNALRDWKIAQKYHNDVIDEDIWNRAFTLLKQAITFAWGYTLNRKFNLDQLYSIIQESGYITNDYGSGRPESGSEHIFASALESKVHIPHALAVVLGIYVMEFISRYVDVPSVYDFSKIPFKSLIAEVNSQKLSQELISQTITTLKPRTDKYTLVNHIQLILETPQIMIDLFTFLKECGFKFK